MELKKLLFCDLVEIFVIFIALHKHMKLLLLVAIHVTLVVAQFRNNVFLFYVSHEASRADDGTLLIVWMRQMVL